MSTALRSRDISLLAYSGRADRQIRCVDAFPYSQHFPSLRTAAMRSAEGTSLRACRSSRPRPWWIYASGVSFRMPRSLYTVIETGAYLRSAERVMTEAERVALVDFFAANPQAGDVIPGAGGLRKVRVPLAGRGKQGGACVISYFVAARGVYLLLAYAKNDQGNLTPDQARALVRLVETLF